jgi:hypothetical protein
LDRTPHHPAMRRCDREADQGQDQPADRLGAQDGGDQEQEGKGQFPADSAGQPIAFFVAALVREHLSMFYPASDFRQYPARRIARAETLGIRGSRHISASYTGRWPP